MNKIVLKDGTEIQATIGVTLDLIEITMSHEDAMANLSKFMNPEVMKEIKYYHGVYYGVYRNYSRFSTLQDSTTENKMHVWMKAEGESSIEEDIPLVDKMYLPKEHDFSGNT